MQIPLVSRSRSQHYAITVDAQHQQLTQTGIQIVEETRPASPSQPYVCIDAIRSFASNSLPILFWGVIGFAGSTIVGSTLAASISMSLAYVYITRRAVAPSPCASMIRHGIAQIGWVWLRGLLIGMGILAISVPLQAQESSVSLMQIHGDRQDHVLQRLARLSANAMLLTQANPLMQWLPTWHTAALEILVQQPNQAYQRQLMANYWLNGPDTASGGLAGLEAQVRSQPTQRIDLHIMLVGGLLLILIVEPLFACRAAIWISRPNNAGGFGWLRFTLRHFGTIALHVWLLRLTSVGALALLAFVPVLFVERFSGLVPNWGWYGSPIYQSAVSVSLAIIGAITTTFETVYTARLFVAFSTTRAGCVFKTSAITSSKFSVAPSALAATTRSADSSASSCLRNGSPSPNIS